MIQIPTKQHLESMYSYEGMTQEQIGNKFDVDRSTVSRWLSNCNISTVGRRGAKVPNVSKKVLEQMYSKYGMTQEQIGIKFNVHQGTVSNWLHKYNIFMVNVIMPPKEVIERMYIHEGMTQEQIGKEFGVRHTTVGRWISKYNIQVRRSGVIAFPMPPKEVIQRMYLDEEMTQEQIGKEFDVIGSTVSKWIRYYTIPTRRGGVIAFPMPPKDDLLSYIAEGLNQHQIAENCNVCDSTIFNWCKNYGIPGMVNGYRFTTPEHINWRDAVLARDNYICQECGVFGDVLHAHHIRPYHDYPELELDVDNGITLCKQCHENIRGHEYQCIVKYEDIVLRDRGIGDHNI